MSVRMALAKLCACACGGAVIGGGAVHVAERPNRPAYVKHIKNRVVARRPSAVARKTTRRRIVTTTTTACAPTVVTVASQGAPVPVPLPMAPG